MDAPQQDRYRDWYALGRIPIWMETPFGGTPMGMDAPLDPSRDCYAAATTLSGYPYASGRAPLSMGTPRVRSLWGLLQHWLGSLSPCVERW